MYKEVVSNVISAEYKKATPLQESRVIKCDKSLATDLGISDRVNVMSKSESYVTVKDTKPDFENNPKYRILNPNKGNLGKVSKTIICNGKSNDSEPNIICN